MPLLTADQADTAARRAATGLLRRGLVPGDRLAMVTPEYATGDVAVAQADTLAVLWAALRLGIVPVLIHPLLTPPERRHILTDSQATGDAVEATECAALVTTPGGVDLPDRPRARPMHYTSGTTGVPKGVVADLSDAEAAAWWDDEIAHWGFDADDVTLVHSPLCHSAPLRFAIGTLDAGGAVALPGRFSPASHAAALTEFTPTTAFTAPSQLHQLLAFGVPASPYRLLAHAGSPCPADLKRRIHGWAGAGSTWEFYGSTEGQFTSCPGTEWEDRPGTVGRAREGRTLSVDEGGQVWCVPPTFARFAYWHDPVKTEAAWRDTPVGRAFTVGDLGRLDSEGYLFLEGRREDLIISGGVNVYPAEVEAAVGAMPGVTEVAVYAIPDERWGQRVAAAVVGVVTEAELDAWARTRLAGYKRPKEWHLVAELPRNSMGKIQRSTLPH
ncbi:MAG: AMP-binding protein [Candidatus Nanopelagicales bacterium]